MTERVQLTPEQAAGTACRHCGSQASPLHPDQTVEVPYSPGVVQQIVTVVCTADLEFGK
ncbi:hypothetical protein F4556_005226 [Kitasatospora gansuensis]|uniref:Uncharacterized protein n=1 Tax=Kitasatospora gansuensis TaxID=258050 RepID=A0A7W7SI32_9ACTN|nr:hypothetical protein [Kitasatospora gansuensis]MBB4949691.1 hypothetical protein [Kitasatospora gansuensis]